MFIRILHFLVNKSICLTQDQCYYGDQKVWVIVVSVIKFACVHDQRLTPMHSIEKSPTI